ncbi:MAG: hypothetical protein KA518_00290 [Acinetobacter sp.]|nr:hypothetical protein [Acinetobacter sp.]
MSDFFDEIVGNAKKITKTVSGTVSEGVNNAQKVASKGYDFVEKKIDSGVDAAKKTVHVVKGKLESSVETGKKQLEVAQQKIENKVQKTADAVTEQTLKRALAFYSAAQKGSDAAQNVGVWLWEVLKGDFHKDPTVGQIATGMVISMIPVVDQICDVRDFYACTLEVREKPNDNLPKVMMVITVIGVVPTIGSFAKGVLKIILSILRRSFKNKRPNFHRLPAFEKDIDEVIEKALKQVRGFLNRLDVQNYLKIKKIFDPYRFVAGKIEILINEGSKNSSFVINQAKYLLGVFDKLIDYVKRFGGNHKLVKEALDEQKKLKDFINNKLPQMLKNNEILAVAIKILRKIQRRLEIESDMLFRASVDKKNLGKVWFPFFDELEAMKKKTPRWADRNVDELANQAHLLPKPPKSEAHYLKEGYPDIGKGFTTFAENSAKATEFKEGEKLYRIVSPGSADNSDCWMRESEYLKLKNKDNWRRYFAVWGSWNSNGEFVTYTVPKGGLKAWEGKAGSQVMNTASRKPDNISDTDWNKKMTEAGADEFSLEGGAIQIFLDPKSLQVSNISERKLTGWGYGDNQLGNSVDLVGVPVLKNNVNLK